MSGGSFNYLYSELETNPLEGDTLESLSSMVKILNGDGQTELANEVENLKWQIEFINSYVAEFLEREITPGILKLLKAIEWYYSGDCSFEKVEEAFANYNGEN